MVSISIDSVTLRSMTSWTVVFLITSMQYSWSGRLSGYTLQYTPTVSSVNVVLWHDCWVTLVLFLCFLLMYGWLQCCASVCCTAKWPSHNYIYIPCIIFHCGLSQETGYTSLCYAVGPHCLSVLNVVVCIYYPLNPSPSHSSPSLLSNHKSVLYVQELYNSSRLSNFLAHN